MHFEHIMALVMRTIAKSVIRIASSLRHHAVHPQAKTGNASALNLLRRLWSDRALVVKAGLIDQSGGGNLGRKKEMCKRWGGMGVSACFRGYAQAARHNANLGLSQAAGVTL